MHICFIEDTLLHRGTQIWVVEAVRDFLARGAQVTLLAPAGSWVAQRCAGTDARIVTYDWDGVAAQDEAACRIWTDALRDCNVALCTVHPPRGRFQCAVFAAHCIAKSDLETCLVTKSGTVVPTYRREFYLPDERVCSSVIAIADFTRRYLIETHHIPSDRVTLIYQGVDLRRFWPTPALREEAMRRYPLSDGAGPVLGCTGSFEPRKGQAVLLEAVSALAAGPLPNVHLMLVGDGPDEQKLKQQAEEMGLAERASFFPFTNEPEYVFGRLDLTVLPSFHKEGLPNVLLESMAMRVPVVASRLGGVPEVVLAGETGYTVEPGDSGQLADAIYRLWADQESYHQMSAYACRLVEEKFDKENQFDRFMNHLRGCVLGSD